MCYLIYLSTNSTEALDELPSDLYQFEHLAENDNKAITYVLEYPYKWYLTGQYGGCSCNFRHLMEANDLTFGPPEEWFEEESDDIASTGAVYDALAHILSGGYKLDIIDSWVNTPPEGITNLHVSLGGIQRDSFRFFENHRFILSL